MDYSAFYLAAVMLGGLLRSTTSQVYRLVGNYSQEGRLEVLVNGVWGTVCDDSFNDIAARVACYSLNFGYFGQFEYNNYGPGTGQIWLDDVQCSGSERDISSCRHSGWGIHNCVHDEDVSISCYATLVPIDISRIASSQSSITIHWIQPGTANNYRMLVNNTLTPYVNYSGVGSSSVTATVYNLPTTRDSYCLSVKAVRGTVQTIETVAATLCNLRTVTTRLVGNHSQEGRLEVFNNGVWGTVCHDLFNDDAARVACYSLNYGYTGQFEYNNYGPGTGQIWLDSVQCTGSETDIANCPHNAWGFNDCAHSQDVSISCYATLVPTDIRWANSSSSSITVRWTQPGNVNNYRILVDNVETSYVRYSGFGSSSVTATVYNLLTASGNYCLSVTALRGTVQIIETAAATVCNLSTAPATPGDIIWVSSAEDSISIYCTQNGTVDSYKMKVDGVTTMNASYQVDDRFTVSATFNSLPIPGRTYCLSVIPIRFGIEGEASVSCNMRTVPAAPGFLNFVSSTEHLIIVQWTQRGNVDSYNVQIVQSDTFEVSYTGLGTPYVTATINNLPTAGISYCLRVFAVSGLFQSLTTETCDVWTKDTSTAAAADALLPFVIALGVVAAVFIIASTVLLIVTVKLWRNSKKIPTKRDTTTGHAQVADNCGSSGAVGGNSYIEMSERANAEIPPSTTAIYESVDDLWGHR
jgi:hypothetical protein